MNYKLINKKKKIRVLSIIFLIEEKKLDSRIRIQIKMIRIHSTDAIIIYELINNVLYSSGLQGCL